MALFYKAMQSIMATKTDDKKWRLNLVKIGKAISTQQLAEMAAEKSSLTPGDVRNVVRSSMAIVCSEPLNNKTMRLEGLGTFTMKAHSRGRGVDKEEDANPSQVGTLLCHFAPEYTRPAAIGTTRALLQGAEFQKIDSIGTSGGNDSGNGDGNTVNNPTA